jgi:hypothetical protein
MFIAGYRQKKDDPITLHHIARGVGIPADHVGVFSGMVGTEDLLDLALLLKAPLLRTDSPRRRPADRGHVGSRGLSTGMDGGRRSTTLLTNLFKPRSIFTWIMSVPPDLGLFSDGEISPRICSILGNGESRVPMRANPLRTDFDRWTGTAALLCAIAVRGLTLGL